jgi:beta-glucosidase-like glycosyl hydrolase
MACAKHVPGHGDTAVDSHMAMPTIAITREVAETREFLPFRAAIDAGVASLMMGHILVPFLDPDRPASLSPTVISDLVRTSWGFDGLVTTDALDMRAITTSYNAGDAAVLAFEAGNDVLLLPDDPIEAIEALSNALESERIGMDRLDDSERRWEVARRFVRPLPSEQQQPPVDLSSHAHMALLAADAAIRINGDTSLLPLGSTQPFAAFAVIDEREADAATTWCNYLAQATEGNSDFAFIDGSISDEECDTMASGVADASVIIFSFFGSAVAYRGSMTSHERIPDVMQRIAAGKPIIVVSCGSPYGMESLPSAMSVYTYSDTMPSLAACVMRLIGRPAGG